jgi:hypothetical protein
MWRIDPLLRNDPEINEATAVVRQRPERKNGGTVFYVVRPEAMSRDRQSSVK